MRAVIGYLVVAAILAVSGGLLWRGSDLERRVAAAERDLVTLRYQEAGAAAIEAPPAWASYLPGAARTVEDAQALGATSKYWDGHYDAVAADPKAKLLAANAAYRALRRDGGNWPAVVGRLDGVVKAYADVLREEPGNAEAAFNFEYATRLRSVIAARRQNVAPVDPTASGITIHGGVGEVPVDADSKKFKMIIPMRPDERQEAEKAGKGGTRIRKG
ncbi:MAG TPA: hypothetical protein PLH72_08645 [Vicinamibacterales bacterium]|nr:hypothetical protein [Vicinamibacterales bacterium]